MMRSRDAEIEKHGVKTSGLILTAETRTDYRGFENDGRWTFEHLGACVGLLD